MRTRFAPSPTGEMHLGNVRTALYSWLAARHQQGCFILRFEDTDTERSTQTSAESILTDLTWLGLHWDEGPICQTSRLARYQEALQKLLDQGLAYRCYCSKERLEQLREQQMQQKLKPRYDGHCRHQAAVAASYAPHVVRFCNPQSGSVHFVDQIRGHITIANSELDDLVLKRSDGMFTYNFAVVIDDLDMQITDVIRGADHITNTPRQINIFQALGATPPRYAHVPTILTESGERLSKRNGAMSIRQYREQGILPEALINYMVRLGWSHQDQEIFSRAELIQYFQISDVHKAEVCINPSKLLWLNQHYMKATAPAALVPVFTAQLATLGLNPLLVADLPAVISVYRERAKTIVELAESSRYLFVETLSYDAASQATLSEHHQFLQRVTQALAALPTWELEALHTLLAELGFKNMLPVRLALTAGTTSPSVHLVLGLLGKQRSLDRLQQALAL
jgi:glutamyl-tRNA synthetase